MRWDEYFRKRPILGVAQMSDTALHVLRCEFANLTAAHRRLNGKKKRPRHLLALLLRWALSVIA